MKHENCLKGLRKLALAFILVMSMAGSSFALDVYLMAEEFTYQDTNPANPYYSPILSGITMWGFAQCTDDTFVTCDPASVPGPIVSATEGETINIHVRNNLAGLYTEPTSVIVPGQVPSLTAGTYPTWTDGTTGARTNANQRVRSFTTETPVTGTGVYTWTGVKAGTYLYQTGTHPGVQVQMGLFGPLIVYPTIGGRAYAEPSTAFDTEVTLLFSEIDPVLHGAVATGNYGPGKTMTSPSEYHPKYSLVNGEPYSPGLAPIPVGSPTQRLLIRFLNAGLVEKTPSLQQGQYLTLIAEDGNPYANAKQQYSLLLPAGKTVDAIFILPEAGYVPVFDRSLNLTNAAASPGGDRVYLQVAATDQFTLTVAKDGTGKGTIAAQSLPGGIDCGLDCSQSYNSGTEIRLVGTPEPGSLLTAWSEAGCSVPGDCIVAVNADTTVTGTFTAFNVIKVLAPKKGDIIPAGSTVTIWWGAPANAVKFRVRYSLNNGTTWKTIVSNVVGNTYSWVVPTPASTKNNVLVRVIGFNAKGANIGADNSGKFTILVP